MERIGLLYIHKGSEGRTTRSLPLGFRFLCILELVWGSSFVHFSGLGYFVPPFCVYTDLAVN
jgi:hypothetical protein